MGHSTKVNLWNAVGRLLENRLRGLTQREDVRWGPWEMLKLFILLANSAHYNHKAVILEMTVRVVQLGTTMEIKWGVRYS